jgi:hypothetical protein
VQSEAKMRFVLLGLVGAAGGAQNCGFVSFAQCMATVSGIGGFCVQNTMYQPSQRARRKRSH